MQPFLLKTPYQISFSGNPMPFVFAVAPYTAVEKQSDVRLIIKVLVEKTYGSSLFEEVRSQTFYPDADGMVSVDIHTIIDPYLEYYLPKLSLQKPVLAPNQRKRYKLSYLLLNGGVPVGTLAETQIMYAIKGGLSYEHWHPYDFFTNLIQDEKQALRYSVPGERVFADESRYLFWLYSAEQATLVDESGRTITDDNGNLIIMTESTLPLQVVFTITDNQGQKYQYALPQTVTSDRWSVGCAPIGFNQVGLQHLVGTDALAVSYTVEVISDVASVVSPITFILDYRNFYRTYDILYRNSVGGLETVRLRGQTDFSADYDRQQAQQIVPPSYYQNLNLIPQVLDNSTEESAKFKGDTGFITRDAAERLRDLFLSVQKFTLVDGKMYPIVINSKSTAFFTNRDSLISTQIEWQQAFVNTFFTPKRLMPSVRACPPVESLQCLMVDRTTMMIMYSLPIPYDRVQVTVGFSVVPDASILMPGGTLTFTYTGNTRTVVQQLTLPLGARIFPYVFLKISASVICDEEGEELSLGPATTIAGQLPVSSSLVAKDDSFTIDSGHNTFVSLDGSVLTNDSDPGGSSIEAVPNAGSTAKGGTFTLYADGTISYLPPSVTFVGADTFDYQVRKVGDTTSATGTVTVQVNAVAVSIFAKLVNRNVVDTNHLPQSRNTKGEIWIDFFSDPAGTQPLDVTAYGLSVNTEVKETNYSHMISDIPASSNTKTTDTTYNPAGTKIQIFNGTYYNLVRSNTNFLLYTEFKRDTVILPGTGYTVI